MTDTTRQFLDKAIETLSQSDPLIKLVQEVKLGRMKATDPGLRAITESWLETYRDVLQGMRHVEREALHRLDPSPRIDVLIESGVLTADHPAVLALTAVFH